MGKAAERPSLRFWRKVDFWAGVSAHRPDLGTCWTWSAARDPRGYGRFGVLRTRTVLAHRFAYESLVGPIPDGLTIDHLCRVPACVRPKHMEPVTTRENTQRSIDTIRATRWNSAKVACPLGHAYTPENTRLDPKGSRHCRSCDGMATLRRSEARRQVKSWSPPVEVDA